MNDDVNWPTWACPEHKLELDDRGDELVCERSHSYPRAGGIARFIHGTTYADAFGAQWNAYRLAQLDSYTGTTISRDRLRECLGEELWNSLDGLHVLEAGCGAGRFTEILLERGAYVTAIDLSNAIDANQETFGDHPLRRAAQADVVAMPFLPQQFDVVFCFGVVQSTPDPEATIKALYEHVKPGGRLVFDHYTWEIGWLLSLSPLVRLYLKHASPEKGIRATESLVKTLLPFHRRLGPIGRKFLDRVSPVMSYYDDYPELNDELQREWALVDTHDSLTDYYKFFRTTSQIDRELRKLGSEDIRVRRGGNGVEAQAKRPAELRVPVAAS